MNPQEALTAMARALWVVDNAQVTARPHVADDGTVTDPVAGPVPPGTSVPVADYLESLLRPTGRGPRRAGLTVRLYLALLIVAASAGELTVAAMWTIATKSLPRDLQWRLGILTDDNGRTRELTQKQLYNLTEAITRVLEPGYQPRAKKPPMRKESDTPVGEKPDDALEKPGKMRRRVKAAGGPVGPVLVPLTQQEQLAALDAIKDALIQATLVAARLGTSYAVDETGVWSWSIGRKKPKNMPPVDPADEDAELAARHREAEAKGEVLPEAPVEDEDPPDEDEAADPGSAMDGTTAAGSTNEGAGSDQSEAQGTTAEVDAEDRGNCSFADWGVKTHKSGRRNAYYGYSMHTIVRVPDVVSGRSDRNSEPLLIEQIEVTPANTDLVEPTLKMVRKIIGTGQAVGDLIGDRHYSYKQFHRWASKLWRLGVRQVLDLRENDHGSTFYDGLTIVDGWPHCNPPEHLKDLRRPGFTATPEEHAEFKVKIKERWNFAMYRNKSPWSGAGDGKTRYSCPAATGKVGCKLADGTLETAFLKGLPIVNAPDQPHRFCQGSVLMQSGAHMKRAQEHYWGSESWLISWNRRTYIEGVFGRIKNPATENIHRGFLQLTGRPLVTLALTAVTVSYNIRELNDWRDRATGSTNERTVALLETLAAHPLCQTTEHVHGHVMLTKEQADQLDDQHRHLQPGDAAGGATEMMAA
jgi:hypothetical protein